LELGLGNFAKKQALAARRGTGAKNLIPLDNSNSFIPSILDTIQADTFATAKRCIGTVTERDDVVPALDAKNIIVILSCEFEACEDDIKARSGQSAEPQDECTPPAGAKSLCTPFDQSHWPAIEPGKTKCTGCANEAKRWTLFGRSY
ncbi:prolyl-tRNA synthetase, partial [Coprinopsis sp. MPI-PUGE-AT-0042]